MEYNNIYNIIMAFFIYNPSSYQLIVDCRIFTICDMSSRNLIIFVLYIK